MKGVVETSVKAAVQASAKESVKGSTTSEVKGSLEGIPEERLDRLVTKQTQH